MKKKLFYTVIFFLMAILGLAQNTLRTADSLFFALNWRPAATIYEKILSDTSQNVIAWNRLGFSNYHLGNFDKAMWCYNKALSFNPPAGLKASVYSRMARVYALKNENQNAIADIDSAFNSGYTNFQELDTLKDFNALRTETTFKNLRQKIYAFLYPCMTDAHAREFDFWIGEWDVYQTGTAQPIVGHSLVQMISGGCAILENWDSPNSTGKSINFIDPNTNKWKQSWSGSYANGNQEFTNGEYRDSAMRFNFETKDAQGNKIIGRFIFYNQGPNQVRQFSESSADGGKAWTTNYDFTYRRMK